MYIALRLLRDGAHTTITTRFPNDAVRRFAAMQDSADWHRLRVVGIDRRFTAIMLDVDVPPGEAQSRAVRAAVRAGRATPGRWRT